MTRARPSPPIVLVTSRASGAGKTTLVEGLVGALTARGLRVAVLKRSHHDVELDSAGKDTGRVRAAGACAAALAGPSLVTCFAPSGGRGAAALRRVAAALCVLAEPDLVIVEGGRSLRGFRRIEVVPPGGVNPRRGADLIAIASDAPAARGIARRSAVAGVPVHARSDYEGLAARLERFVALSAARRG